MVPNFQGSCRTHCSAVQSQVRASACVPIYTRRLTFRPRLNSAHALLVEAAHCCCNEDCCVQILKGAFCPRLQDKMQSKLPICFRPAALHFLHALSTCRTSNTKCHSLMTLYDLESPVVQVVSAAAKWGARRQDDAIWAILRKASIQALSP